MRYYLLVETVQAPLLLELRHFNRNLLVLWLVEHTHVLLCTRVQLKVSPRRSIAILCLMNGDHPTEVTWIVC